MVQSGLSDRVDVSHYRLALHLTTAFVILGCVVWLALEHAPRDRRVRLHTIPRGQQPLAFAILALMVLQTVLGALVAGHKAGLVHNTWPLMDGALIPPGLLEMSPWWLNFAENPTTVQFDHRLLAYLLIALAVWHAWVIWRRADDERVVTSALVVAGAFVVQAGIGVWTLLAAGQAAEIPIVLGLLHQGGAAVVFGLIVWHVHRLRGAIRP